MKDADSAGVGVWLFASHLRRSRRCRRCGFRLRMWFCVYATDVIRAWRAQEAGLNPSDQLPSLELRGLFLQQWRGGRGGYGIAGRAGQWWIVGICRRRGRREALSRCVGSIWSLGAHAGVALRGRSAGLRSGGLGGVLWGVGR